MQYCSNETQSIVVCSKALDATKEVVVIIEGEVITDGPQLNTATFEGKVDTNAFQSFAYLN